MNEFLVTVSATFGLVALAELGDKTQLVCMTLAARHPPLPVLLGAVVAFAILNLLAVLFGAVVAAWLPEWLVAAAVAILFAIFGLNSLRAAGEENVEVRESSGRSVFVSAFALIFLAELGDKTQLAVAGLASAQAALPVWVGGTLALAFTSALGVWAGQTLLRRLPVHVLHRVSGILFLALAAFAAWRAIAALSGRAFALA
ncbi:MAG: TMEM165/GDT1 family protein [Candidatus Competibacter sp.]|nr:TMEM165/GDT1 family protein [Candidatus Competibacter sp.]